MKLGVPFMNSTTGSVSITFSILSRSSFSLTYALPLVVILNSWIVPSASGCSSAP